MEKAFLYASVLTIDELRNFNCKSKAEQQRTSHEVYYILLVIVFSRFPAVDMKGRSYTYTGVGLSALLVSTYRAARRPIDCGTGDRLAPRFSVM